MGVYRSYSSTLLSSGGGGSVLSKRQWSVVSSLLAIVALCVVCSLLASPDSMSERSHSKARILHRRQQQQQQQQEAQQLATEDEKTSMHALYKQLEAQHEHEAQLEREVAALQRENEAMRHREPAAAASDGIRLEHGQARLPAGSGWCSGDTRGSRHCRFENLCYLPRREAYVVAKTPASVLGGVPAARGRDALVDLTSLQDHSAFFFDFDEVDPALRELGGNFTLRVVDKPTFILSRFLPGNIMHTMHDDILGMYHLHREFAEHRGPGGPGDSYIQFADYHGGGEFEHLYQYFTEHPLLYKQSLTRDPGVVTCFRNAIVGQSKAANWYQYGFGGPQGPIANKTVDGARVREVADFIVERSGFDLRDVSVLPPSTPHFNATKVAAVLAANGVAGPDQRIIAVFSRLRNRKLENEAELKRRLEQRYPQLPVLYVRMEELSFLEQVALLRRAELALGMHGSILVMGMFMPRHAGLLELYPYAVPADNYTPYRTMARLPNMHMVYRAWQNAHERNTRAFPDRHLLMGGVMHLPPAERDAVLHSTTVPKHTCCTNPYWLFRIFQDTTAEPDEILALTDEILAELRANRERQGALPAAARIAPSPVDAKSVRCTFDYAAATLSLAWEAPWNGGAVDRYAVWDHNTFREYLALAEAVSFPADLKKVAQVWIQTVSGDVKGRYSARVKCVPEGVVDNIQ